MKVTRYHEFENKGSLIASFDIVYKTEWGGRYDKNLKLFEKNGQRWVSFNSKAVEDEHGQIKYYSDSGFLNRSAWDMFQATTLQAIELYHKEEALKSRKQPSATLDAYDNFE